MGEETAVQLVVSLLFGAIVAMIATKRGRSGIAWFLLGALFNCFALILVLVLPDLKVQEERARRLELENRRLRERLRKDRQVADQRHAEAARRLAVHDRALALDTSGELAEPDSGAALPPPLAEEAAAEPERWEELGWHYVDDGRAVGPIEFPDLRRLWRSGEIGGSTLVWNEELEDWRALRDVPALEEGLRG